MNALKKHKRTVFLVLGILAVLVFGLHTSVHAADIRSGDVILIGADEVIDDDLIASGQRVQIDGTVRGDVIVSGQEVVINGTVEGSLMMAGQILKADGQVLGSLYAGGYSLTLGDNASIARNLYFGGFSLDTGANSDIGRSMHFGGYQAIVNGGVADDILFSGAALSFNGSVGGDIKGEISAADQGAPEMPFFPGAVPVISPGLQIGPGAEIGGTESLRITQPTVDPGQPNLVVQIGRAITARIGEFITLLIVGLLLFLVWPKGVPGASDQAESQPLPSAGWGCLTTLIFVIAVPIAGIAIFLLALIGGLITFGQLGGDILGIGGIALSLLVTLFGFVLSTVTKVIIAYLVGRLILTRLAPQLEPGTWTNMAYLALGAVLYEIVRIIPLLGWLVAVVVTLVGLGALYLLLRAEIQPGQVVAAETLPPPAPAAAAQEPQT